MDENIRDIGGHYLELASLLCQGASELGYGCRLVTHQSLSLDQLRTAGDDRLAGVPIEPAFRVRRMERWSLGVDGASRVARDLDGSPIGGTRLDRLRQRWADRTSRRKRRPQRMLNAWAETFETSLRRFRPTADDRIVINTGCDFQLLALAQALGRMRQRGDSGPLDIHVVFHFAVFASAPGERAIAFGEQVRRAIDAMPDQRVSLHATTQPLANQLADVGVSAAQIPYPTRHRNPPPRPSAPGDPVKVVLAGIPRAEKGKQSIRSLLQAIESEHLRTGRLIWSMQVPTRRWERYVPESMRDLVKHGYEQTAPPSRGALELVHGNLAVQDYHRWLDGAGLGLFLYDPARYAARCSGVLLEMMIRGIPVMVPDGCWLADQVRQAEQAGDRIGWIYRELDEIPRLLGQACDAMERVRPACRLHAATIAARHDAGNTLRQMGIPDRRGRTIKAAG